MVDHPELMEGYNTEVPIERYIMFACLMVLVRNEVNLVSKFLTLFYSFGTTL